VLPAARRCPADVGERTPLSSKLIAKAQKLRRRPLEIVAKNDIFRRIQDEQNVRARGLTQNF
jgi:hypothetical protein